MFAKYWDKVEDSRDISGVSRFMSGGIGGMASQLGTSVDVNNVSHTLIVSHYVAIYPIETMKVQYHAITVKGTCWTNLYLT